MLYASAAFMFLFLPLTLGIFALVQGRVRKYVLLSASVLFYVFANLKTPLAIPVIAAVVVITHFAGKYIARTGSKAFTMVVTAVDLLAFFSLRIIYEASSSSFLFPLGAAVYLLMAVSYLIDIKRRDCEPETIFDTALYLTFFPVMVAGPVVKYKDFKKYISNIAMNIDHFAYGAKLFMTGFIEVVAVSAVLIEAYKKVMEVSDEGLNIVFGILAAALILIASFFAVTGWTDMACGISLMFGIDIPRDCGFAPAAVTPLQYFNRIFKGLGSWIDDYIVSPLTSSLESKKRLSGVLGSVMTVLVISLWIKTSVPMVCAALIISFITILLRSTGADGALQNKKYLRPLGWLITSVIMSFYWTSVTVSGLHSLFSEFLKLSFSEINFNTYYVYISLSGGKFISVAAAALLIFAPLSFYEKAIIKHVPKKVRYIVEAILMVLLLAAFVFTVLFFMPQYPQYASHAFEYLIF